eukprot:122477-Pelagomonas_calceolata.AAC.5
MMWWHKLSSSDETVPGAHFDDIDGIGGFHLVKLRGRLRVQWKWQTCLHKGGLDGCEVAVPAAGWP